MDKNQWDELEQWVKEEQAAREFKVWIETQEFIDGL